MKVTLSEESGEWRATFETASVENNGVRKSEVVTVSLSVANAEADWNNVLKTIMEYAETNL